MELVKGTPGLWTEVQLGRPDVVNEALMCSGTRPLDVAYDGRHWKDFWDQPETHFLPITKSIDLLAETATATATERTRTLHILTSDIDMCRDLLNANLPILEHLSLVDRDDPALSRLGRMSVRKYVGGG